MRIDAATIAGDVKRDVDTHPAPAVPSAAAPAPPPAQQPAAPRAKRSTTKRAAKATPAAAAPAAEQEPAQATGGEVAALLANPIVYCYENRPTAGREQLNARVGLAERDWLREYAAARGVKGDALVHALIVALRRDVEAAGG